MLKTLKTIRNCTLSAKDGEIGMVRDLFFDDEHWTVRYLIVNTSGWLLGRNVLISPRSLGVMDSFHDTITVDLTREQVKNSPNVDTERPMTRAQELEYHRYFGWPVYWAGVGPEVPPPSAVFSETGYPSNEDVPDARRSDTHLRGARELEGYHVNATDGSIGHVEELLIESENWRVDYLLLDTKNWWPGKTVVVPTRAFGRVDWYDRKIDVTLTREEVKSAPEFNELRFRSGALSGELQRYFETRTRSDVASGFGRRER